MRFSDVWWILLLMAIGSYLIGSVNFSIIISKMKGRDIRKLGSGNPGMMNMSRNFGMKIGVLIFFLDMLKGAIPTFVGWIVFKDVHLDNTAFILADLTKYLCGFFAVLGHIFPIYLKFKGGKGISTTIGAFLVAEPLVTFIAMVCCLIFIFATNMGAMGSLIAVTPPAIAAEVRFYLNYLYKDGSVYQPPEGMEMTVALLASIIFVLGICILTWVAHHSNIGRLIKGDEHETSWGAMLLKMRDKKRAERLAKKNAEKEVEDSQPTDTSGGDEE